MFLCLYDTKSRPWVWSNRKSCHCWCEHEESDKKLNNVSTACACLWALSTLWVLMCRLKRVNWCSIGSFRVSSPAVPGTFCIILHTPGLYSLFPSATVLLHCLTQLKMHSDSRISKPFEQHNLMLLYVHCIFYWIYFWRNSPVTPSK